MEYMDGLVEKNLNMYLKIQLKIGWKENITKELLIVDK